MESKSQMKQIAEQSDVLSASFINISQDDGSHNSDAEEPQQEEEKTIHFYWISNKAEANITFSLRIKSLPNVKEIGMSRLEENIFYAEATIPGEEFHKMNEIRYSYIKYGIQETLERDEEQEVERTKSKKYHKLNTFFDSQRSKQYVMLGKVETPEHFFRFLIKNFNKPEMHFGKPQIFQDFFKYLLEDSVSIPYGTIFKALLPEYQSNFSDEAFNLYMLEMISYFDKKQLNKKKKYFQQITQDMQKQQIGFQRKLLEQILVKDQNPEGRSSLLVQGLQLLIEVNPLLGLEFFNEPLVIPSKQEYLKSLNLKDEQNYAYVKGSINKCFQEIGFTKQELRQLIEYLLTESKDLEIFLSSVEYLIQTCENDSIDTCMKTLKTRFGPRPVKEFVKDKLERVISIRPLQKVLKNEIQDQIYANLRNNVHVTSNFAYLMSNPDILDLYFLRQIVEIKTNNQLQKEYKQLILRFMTQSTGFLDPTELKEMLVINFTNLITHQQNIGKCHQILCEFIELTSDQCFQKHNYFSQPQVIKSLKRSMVTYQNIYPVNILLNDVIQVLSQPDKKYTNELIDVTYEIVQKTNINEISVKTILDLIYPNDLLLFDELRPISDFIFSKKLPLLKNVSTSSLFDDDLLYKSLKISINDTNDFLKKLNENVQKFLTNIKTQQITLRDINQIIANRKRFLEPMLIIIDPTFDTKELEELVNINKIFKQNIEKHQTFLSWAQKSNIAVDITNFEKKIKDIILRFESFTAQKALSQDNWTVFQQFNTIEKYYHFKDSELFNKLFQSMTVQIGQNIFATPEEHKQQILASSMVKTITMSQFDRTSEEILFDKICKEHFTQLMKYPNTVIKQETLQKYWNIDSNRVLTELTYVLDYENNIMKNKDSYISMELSNHLQKYGNQKMYYEQANTLISLKGFAQKQSIFVIDDDAYYQKLKKYVSFINGKTNEVDLQVIAQEVSKVEDIFRSLNESEKINFEILQELSKSKDTFEFSIQNIGLDFNDLFERLEEDSSITNATISDMNSVSNYFQRLFEQLKAMEEGVDFLGLLEFLSKDLFNHIAADQNANFRGKLQNCNANLQAIRQISDATKNLAENTLNIIEECLQKGVIHWIKDKDKFDYKIIINLQDTNQGSIVEEELKEGSDNQSVISIQQPCNQTTTSVKQLVYDSDSINQHSSRAILMIHSKTNPDQQQQIEQDVRLFASIVKYSGDISNNFKGLSQYGKLKTNIENEAKPLFIHYINKQDIGNELKNKKKSLKQDLEEWKGRLTDLRSNYYFLNYVPNSMIQELMDTFDNPENNSLIGVIMQFKDHKILDANTPDDILCEMGYMINEGQKYYTKVQEIWASNLISSELPLRQKIQTLTTSFQLQESKVQYRYVMDDLQLIKAIVSLFTISGILPQSSDILFCTEQTQINEIEIFVMRSMLCHQHIQRTKLFLIANFQKLSFNTQFLCYDYIKKQEQQHQNSHFLLYFVSVFQDIKSAHLIEEVRTLSQNHQQFIRDDQLKEVFKKFNFIRIVRSEQCGYGKTEYIKDRTQSTDRKNKNVDKKQLVRIPIYGELNRKKLIELHKKRIADVVSQYGSQNLAIHYDVYPTFKEELNVIMFELLILGSLNDYQNNTFYLPQNLEVYVELSQSLNKDYIYSFLAYLKNRQITWENMNLKLKVGSNVDDKVQKVCRYLQALEDLTKYKPELLLNPEKEISTIECQMIVKRFFVTKVLKPNYYYINSFITFVNDQISKMEASIYFHPENLYEQMSGYFTTSKKKKGRELHREIVDQLVKLALKVCIVEKFMESNEQTLGGNSGSGSLKKTSQEDQANRFKELQWDVYNNPFTVINDSGTITPIYKRLEDVPKVIREYQERSNKKDKDSQHFKNYDELTNDEYIDKILEICVDEAQKEKLRKQKDLKNLVFTLDNFMKLVLIYLRIRAFQPIILMGETGVGKTSLVEYLCKIIDAEFRVLNVHAGVNEEEILSFVEEAQQLAKSYEPVRDGQKRKIILFFDEINTNINISGLLKEIFVDRHFQGVKLEDNICLVSACNPYQLRKQEVSSQTSGIKMNDKDQTMSKLVYRVLPLPESMVAYIWDYKSLSEQEEKKYIKKMVEKTYENAKIVGKSISLVKLWIHKDEAEKLKVVQLDREIENVSLFVQKSQTYIKKEEDSPWAVSLRDVSRFCKLYVYFNNNNFLTDIQNYGVNPVSLELRRFSTRDIALVLSIYFCYVIRISVYNERIKYINFIQQQTKGIINMGHLEPSNFKMIVNKEQDRFLDQMEIKAGIGKNAPLKENIFVIITCILNQIPLIITGKPGSSKTLAMNLIHKSFKGQISTNDFFKKFPTFLAFYYQGSEQSTSKGIERIYQRAHITQEKVRDKNTQVVVIFDEIGLAEKSIHNPLKVLHSLLEPPKVSTVGISNWSLDASKMNRVITLSRTDPDVQDLIESAKSIAQGTNPVFAQKYLTNLVNWYINYIQRQQSLPKFKHFHGLRDFYSMIKFISHKISSDEDFNEYVITHGIQRNFAGSSFDLVVQTLETHLEFKNGDLLKRIKPDELIKKNLEDYDSRHLMIITDNFENTLQFIQDECQAKERQYEIFYGSDFPDDQNEESLYKQINEIILQMENGTLCIFLNLNSIYQSFYDMLNQNYQEIGSQKFCKVAIGPDSSRCLVHENFKCILIVDQNQIDKLDPPLLNRFEKQLFTEDISIDANQKQIISKLNNWINNLQVKNFNRKQMFPTIDESQSLQQLLIQTKDLYGEDLIEEECKRSLIRVATFQGIIRSLDSRVPDREYWINEYMNVQNHYNLYGLLKYYTEHFNDEKEKCFKKTKGFNLIVYSFYAMIKLIENDELIKTLQVDPIINLSSIHRKKQFEQKVEDFFSKNNSNKLLLIYADMFNDSKNRINLCRSIINNQRTKRILEANKQPQQLIEESKSDSKLVDKHVCFIIRIDQHRDDQNISFGKEWRQYTVDLLNGKGQTEITVEQVINNDFETLIKIASSQSHLFETSIVESMSKIYYNKNQEFIQKRIKEIQQLFEPEENIEYLRGLILQKVKQTDNFDTINQTWRLQVVKNEFLMKSNLTFHGAALEYIKTELVKYLAFIVFYLEQDGVINAYNKESLFSLAKDYFKNLFKNNYISNRIQDMYFLAQNFDRIKFPLARLIHQQFLQLKIQYIKILKEQNRSQGKMKIHDQKEMLQLAQSFSQLDREDEKKKSEKRERAKIEKFKKMWMKDRQLVENISNLEQWCLIYFPQDYIDQKILTLENPTYIENFSYLLDNLDIITANSYHDKHNKFIKTSLTIILKGEFESKSQIYGVYWKYENLLTIVWKLIKDNHELFSFDEMIDKLEKENLECEEYKRPKQELCYLPREAYIQCLIKVFYDLYYPSENLKGKFIKWKQNVKETFQKLNDLAFSYLDQMTTFESRVIIFLLKFKQEVIYKTSLKEVEQLFITFAQNIKEIFKQPEKVIKQIQNLTEKLIPDTDEKLSSSLNKKIQKFIFEYIIEGASEDDDIDLEFLLNDIAQIFIQPDQESDQQLQNDEKFKFLMQKILSIALYQFEEMDEGDDDEEEEEKDKDESQEKEKDIAYLRYLDALSENHKDYQKFIDSNENIQVFEDFLKMNKQLKLCDAFVVSITDLIEETLDEEQCLNYKKINIRMKTVEQILQDDSCTLFQKMISVAFFKKIASYYCEEMLSYLTENSQFNANECYNALDEFYKQPSEQQKLRIKPFMIYLLKILYQEIDILKMYNTQLLEKSKFIKNYMDIENQGTKTFSYIQNLEYINHKKEIYHKIESPTEDFSRLGNFAPFKKFCSLLGIIEFTYLSGKSLEPQQQFRLFGNIENEVFTPNSVVTDKTTRSFLLPFCTNQFEQFEKRNKFIKLKDSDDAYYFKLIQMFLGAAALSGNSFLNEFFVNPKNIKEYYIPFVQNIKEDFEYQLKIKNNERIKSLQCQQCNGITLVIELSSRPQNINKLFKHGDKICQSCNVGESEGKYMKESDKINNNKFSTEQMATKSYIPFDLESFKEIKIRNLSENEIAIGRIILHSLLMLSFSFSDQETEILAMILPDYPFSQQSYDKYVTRVIHYLWICFNFDWSTLKNNLFINDEKLIQIIEYLIIEILKNISKFKIDLLQTIQGRKTFEEEFQKLCAPVFKDINAFFSQNIGQENDIEKLLMEQNSFDKNDYYNLLRVKRPITINLFERYLNENVTEEYNFFKLLFEQKESIQNISYLKSLVQWARFVFTKWNAQLTYDEATELSIQEIIEKENTSNKQNRDYISKIEKDFAKFQQAWNKFQNLIIRDTNASGQSVEVIVPAIAPSTKIIYCCITTDRQDQPGHIFYLLMKYLAQKQNLVLNEAKNMVKKKNNNPDSNIHGMQFQDISLLDLKKEQIIKFREKTVKIKRKGTSANFNDDVKYQGQQAEKDKEKEKFEKIIIDNSACNLKYGQGKQIQYDMEQIKSDTVELLLHGKQMIDLEQKHNFQFINIGNLYSQFEDINSKIQQENTETVQAVLDRIQPEDIHSLLGQLRVTMNFIQTFKKDDVKDSNNNSKDNTDKNLSKKTIVEFMRVLKIIDNESPLTNDLYLKHIICLYEKVEERVENVEVEKINTKYQTPLNQKDYQQLGQLINEKKDDIENLMHIIGRLCIRQLRNFQKNLLEENLFKFLCQEQNSILYTKFNDREGNDERKQAVKRTLEDFQRANVQIKHAKEVYNIFRQCYEKMEEEKREQEEQANQIKKKIVVDRIYDEIETGDILKKEKRKKDKKSGGGRKFQKKNKRNDSNERY